MPRALYVGGLADEVTLDILRAAFIPFGEVTDVQLPLDAAGDARGFGFVEYEDEADAAAAIENMEGAELFGRTLRVNFSKQGGGAGGGGGAGRAVWAEAADWYKSLGKDKGEEEAEEGGAEGEGATIEAEAKR